MESHASLRRNFVLNRFSSVPKEVVRGCGQFPALWQICSPSFNSTFSNWRLIRYVISPCDSRWMGAIELCGNERFGSLANLPAGRLIARISDTIAVTPRDFFHGRRRIALSRITRTDRPRYDAGRRKFREKCSETENERRIFACNSFYAAWSAKRVVGVQLHHYFVTRTKTQSRKEILYSRAFNLPLN